jgi:hypothetical protein
MEGTRNERVGILVASYIIGFITAYIAFGVIQLEDSLEFVQVPTQNMASVIASQQVKSSTETYVAVDSVGLIIIKDNERTLLSATGDANQSDFFDEGEHVAISDYSLAPDKMHVYFCELPSQDADSCRPYIYSLVDSTVYPVLVKGERVAFEAKDHKASWSAESELIVQ